MQCEICGYFYKEQIEEDDFYGVNLEENYDSIRDCGRCLSCVEELGPNMYADQ